MKKNYTIHEYDIPKEVLAKIQSVAVDTEALGLNIRRDRLCLVQMCINDEENHIVSFKDPIYDKSPNLVKLMKDKKIEKIFHYARFDMGIIYQYLKVMPQNIICTKIMSKIFRTFSDRHGLKEICRELLRVELNKAEGVSDWGSGHLTPSQIEYAINDVIHLHKLRDVLIKNLKREGRLEVALQMCSIMDKIVFCESNCFDPIYLINHH